MRGDPSSQTAITRQAKRMLKRTPLVAASKHFRNMGTNEGGGGEMVLSEKSEGTRKVVIREFGNECGRLEHESGGAQRKTRAVSKGGGSSRKTGGLCQRDKQRYSPWEAWRTRDEGRTSALLGSLPKSETQFRKPTRTYKLGSNLLVTDYAFMAFCTELT